MVIWFIGTALAGEPRLVVQTGTEYTVRMGYGVAGDTVYTLPAAASPLPWARATGQQLAPTGPVPAACAASYGQWFGQAPTWVRSCGKELFRVGPDLTHEPLALDDLPAGEWVHCASETEVVTVDGAVARVRSLPSGEERWQVAAREVTCTDDLRHLVVLDADEVHLYAASGDDDPSSVSERTGYERVATTSAADLTLAMPRPGGGMIVGSTRGDVRWVDEAGEATVTPSGDPGPARLRSAEDLLALAAWVDEGRRRMREAMHTELTDAMKPYRAAVTGLVSRLDDPAFQPVYPLAVTDADVVVARNDGRVWWMGPDREERMVAQLDWIAMTAAISPDRTHVVVSSFGGGWVELDRQGRVTARGRGQLAPSYAGFTTDGDLVMGAVPPRGGAFVVDVPRRSDRMGALRFDTATASVRPLAAPDLFVSGVHPDGDKVLGLDDAGWALVRHGPTGTRRASVDPAIPPRLYLADRGPVAAIAGQTISEDRRATWADDGSLMLYEAGYVSWTDGVVGWEWDTLLHAMLLDTDDGPRVLGLPERVLSDRTVRSLDGEVLQLFDPRTGASVYRSGPVTMLLTWASLSDDGSTLYLCGEPSYERMGDVGSVGHILVVDLAADRATELTLDHPVSSCVPHGDELLVAGPGAVGLLDPATGSYRPAEIPNRRLPVAFPSPTSDHFVVSSPDEGAVVLDDSLQEVLRVYRFRDGQWAVLDREGRFDAPDAGQSAGLHWVVDGVPVALDQLKDRYFEPGLLAKWLGQVDEPLREVIRRDELALAPEVVELVPPTEGDPTLRLRLRERGGGIGAIRVHVNGREVFADARASATMQVDDDGLTSMEVVMPAHVVLRPGDNEVVVRTHNTEAYLSSRGFSAVVHREAPEEREPPRLFGLVVGVSRYGSDALTLRYAARDARVVAEALEVAGGGLFGADRTHLTVLSTDDGSEAPTREAVLAALSDIEARARPDDVVVVFVAGHGISERTPEGDAYYFLTRDATSDRFVDPAVRSAQTLSGDELADALRAIPAAKQLLVLDTCAAGAMVDAGRAAGLSSAQRRVLERMKDRTGLFILAGSAADRVSFESSTYRHGYLTAALMLALHDVPAAGEVEAAPWLRRARELAEQLARGEGRTQVPQLAAPAAADSFAVGLLDASARRTLPQVEARPLLGLPHFEDKATRRDDLGLATALTRYLADLDHDDPLGFGVLPHADHPGAWRLLVDYKVRGGQIKASADLVPPAGGQVHTITFRGDPSDPPALFDELTEELEQELTP